LAVTNRGVELAAFRYPQSRARVPAELGPLMKAITENRSRSNELRERYTCRPDRDRAQARRRWRVKETETRAYEVTPVGAMFVERLMSVNGKGTVSLRAREGRQNACRRKSRSSSSAAKRGAERGTGARQGEKEEEGARRRDQRLPEDQQITSVRREMFQGHEVDRIRLRAAQGNSSLRIAPQDVSTSSAGTDLGAKRPSK